MEYFQSLYVCIPIIFILKIRCTPTITGVDEFYPRLDAEDLHKALKSSKVDEETIREIFAYRNCSQRQEIQAAYKEKYNQEITAVIHKQLSGHYKTLATCMFFCNEQILSVFLNKAFIERRRYILRWGLYTNNVKEITRPMVMSTESNKIRENFQTYYETRYHRSVLKMVTRLRRDYQSVIVEITTRKRLDTEAPGDLSARDYADRISRSVKHWGKNRQILDKALLELPLKKVRDVMKEYETIRKEDLRHTVVNTKHMKGEKRIVYKSLIQFLNNPLDYYVRILHDAVVGAGTDETALMLVILYRSEVDMVEVESHFHERYPQHGNLRQKIDGDLSGAFQGLLMSFLTLSDADKKLKDDQIRKRLENQRTRLVQNKPNPK